MAPMNETKTERIRTGCKIERPPKPTKKAVSPKRLTKQLGEALRDAHAHLLYCGFGDKWEREVAEHCGLRETIEAALLAWEEAR